MLKEHNRKENILQLKNTSYVINLYFLYYLEVSKNRFIFIFQTNFNV